MANLAAFIQSMVSNPEPVGKVTPGAGGSLMELGQMLAQKKQQNRYFEHQKTQEDDSKRSAALERLRSAILNPGDKFELQSAISEGKKYGVEVEGIESLLSGQKPEAAPEGEPAPEAAPPAAAGEPAQKPPDWLKSYMEGQGEVSLPEQTERTPGGMVAPGEPSAPRAPPARASLIGTGESPSLAERPGRSLQTGQLPPPEKNGVTIKVQGQPYAKLSLDDIQGYRGRQAAVVAHVFQPIIDNAADETEKRAAEIAQQQAVEAYNAGYSKEKAVEFGNKAWTQLINMRFKRDWTKFPPGWKPAVAGGGMGSAMGEKAATQIWNTLEDNERQWVETTNKEFKVPGAQQAIADAGLIEAATHAETPLAQNQGLMRILKEMSGTAVTNPEAQRFYEGIGIMGQADLLLRRIEGGDVTPEIAAGVREIAGLIRNRASSQIGAAGDFIYKRMLGNTLFPGSDDLRVNRARELRSLYTGESLTPMKKGKGGNLEPIKESSGSKVDALLDQLGKP